MLFRSGQKPRLESLAYPVVNCVTLGKLLTHLRLSPFVCKMRLITVPTRPGESEQGTVAERSWAGGGDRVCPAHRDPDLPSVHKISEDSIKIRHSLSPQPSEMGSVTGAHRPLLSDTPCSAPIRS